jgi:hypothetical protein
MGSHRRVDVGMAERWHAIWVSWAQSVITSREKLQHFGHSRAYISKSTSGTPPRHPSC